MKVSICISTFNRKDKSVACIESVLEAAPTAWEIEWLIVDAGSVDGTTEAIFDLGLSGDVIHVNSSSYWSRSMNTAMSSIAPDSDYALLLNDDVILKPDSLIKLMKISNERINSILVGQTNDPSSSQLTYGGYLRTGQHPLRLRRVIALDDLLEIDTFNGNIVFIPRFVIDKVGIIDAKYEHAYGDLDYGYRARKNAIMIYLLPGFLGTCVNDHDLPQIFFSRFQKLRYILELKRLPWRSQWRFTKKYGGFLWPIYFLAPYLNVLFFNKLPNQGYRKQLMPKANLD